MAKEVKKLKLYRQSGLPVDLSSRKAYEEAWKLFYDKAAERAGLDMLRLQRFLRFGERQLVRQHNVQVFVDLPQSARAWTKLIQKFEDCPIMVARSADGSEVVGVLMDSFQP